MALILVTSAPLDTQGSDSDFALNITTRFFIGPKANGTWANAQYLALQGPSGPGVMVGQGAPSSSVGAVGQGYLDSSTGYFYGPKKASGWGSAASSLIGPTGARGSSFTFGTAEPGIEYQNIGDVYFRTTTNNLYYKITNAIPATTPQYPNGWKIVGSLQGSVGATGSVGPAGPTGPAGPASTVAGPTGAAGKDGATFRTGTGAPSSSNPATQNDNDFYFATDLRALYGPRSSGSWGAGTSLVGATGSQGSQGATGSAGLSVLTGSGAPASTLGSQGQAYIDTTAWVGYVKGSSAWSAGTSLVGPTGATGSQGPVGSQGLSVLSGSGAPASTLGVQGQPGYIDTSAGALYGAKGASAWPSSPLSLIGPQGATGPASASLVNGTGAPSSTNPGGTIAAGSFYIQTDASPNRLFGPYSASTGWPSSYTAMGGGTFQTCSGPPASSLGSVGDCAFDLTNGLFYPPKTSSGWTVTPINMVGPTGPAGPSTAYRNIVRGSCWAASGAATAGATYNIYQQVTQNSSTTYGVPMVETMYAPGSLYAVTANSPAGVGASVWTLNILKNGTQVAQLPNFLTLGSAMGSAYKILPSGLNFVAGDNITMTGVPSTSASNQSFNCALAYTTNT